MQNASHTRFFRLIYGNPKRYDMDNSFNISFHIASAVMVLKKSLLPCADIAAHQIGSVFAFEPFRKVRAIPFIEIGPLPDAFASFRTRNSFSFPGLMQSLDRICFATQRYSIVSKYD